MNGLRVYIHPLGADVPGEYRVFYSRRADGPFYCWHYEEELGQWRCSRVHPAYLTLKELCVARWKAVPIELQVRLGEHYMD